MSKVKFQQRQSYEELVELGIISDVALKEKILREKALKEKALKEKAEGILNDFSLERNYSSPRMQQHDCTTYLNEIEIKAKFREQQRQDMEKRMREQREHQENMSCLWNVLLPFIAIGVLFAFVLLIWFSLSILHPYLQ